MLPAESRKTHVLPVRAFGDCPENVFADRICRTNTFLFYLFFWLLSRKYPKEICPCDDFEPKADLRDYGIASGSGERGQRVLRNRGIAPSSGWRGRRGLRKHRAVPDDRGHSPPGQCGMSASPRKDRGMLCGQAPESGKGSCAPQSGGEAQKKRRHSGFKPAWAAQGCTNRRGKDGLRCVRLSDLRTGCGAGHRAAACLSGAAVGRLCREARCRRGASRHGESGKIQSSPGLFPEKAGDPQTLAQAHHVQKEQL